MEEEAFLPQEITVLILTFLPVKTLLRFTCVSKRFRFVILSDPKFARSQFKAASELKTLTHRLLLSTNEKDKEDLSLFESIELDTSLFGDSESSSSSSFSVKKLESPCCEKKVFLLESINGIVFLAFNRRIFYMWNPSIGFFKRLPDLVGLSPRPYNDIDLVYGVGYLPATDDYRLFIYCFHRDKRIAALFSTRDNCWKKLQGCPVTEVECPGTYLKEALHWVQEDYQGGRILALDLCDEEGKFREMSPPNYGNEEDGYISSFNCLGVSPGGCLSLIRFSDYKKHD